MVPLDCMFDIIVDRGTVAELRRLRISITDFEVREIIGRGHFGEVQLVREKQTGSVYALKVLRKTDTLSQHNVSQMETLSHSDVHYSNSLFYIFKGKENLIYKYYSNTIC